MRATTAFFLYSAMMLVAATSVTTVWAKDSPLATQLKAELASKSFATTRTLVVFTIEDNKLYTDARCTTTGMKGYSGERFDTDIQLSSNGEITNQVNSLDATRDEVQLAAGSPILIKDVKVKGDRIEVPFTTPLDGECNRNPKLSLKLGKGFESRYSYDDIMSLIAGVVNIPRHTELLQLEARYRDKKVAVEQHIAAFPRNGTTQQQLTAAAEIHEELLEMFTNRQRLASIKGRNIPEVDTVSKQSFEWSGTLSRLLHQVEAEQQEAKRTAELKADEEAKKEAQRIAKAKEEEEKAIAASKQREASLREAAKKSGWKLEALKLLSERIYPGARLSAAGGGWIRVNQSNGGVNFLVRDELGTGPLFLLVVSCYNGDPILGVFDGVDSPGSLVRVSALYGQQEENGIWRMGPNYMLIPDNPKGTAYRALTGHMFSVVKSGVWSAMFDTSGLPYSTVEKVCSSR